MLAVSVILLAALAVAQADSYLSFLDSKELEAFLPGLSGRTVVNKLVAVAEACNVKVEEIEQNNTRDELRLLDRLEELDEDSQQAEVERLQTIMLHAMEEKEERVNDKLESCKKTEVDYLDSLTTSALQFFDELLVGFSNEATQFREMVKKYRVNVSLGLQLCVNEYEELKGDRPPEVFQVEKMCRTNEVNLFLTALDKFIETMDSMYLNARAALYRGILPVQLPTDLANSEDIPEASQPDDVASVMDVDTAEDLLDDDDVGAMETATPSDEVVSTETTPLPTTTYMPSEETTEEVLTASFITPTEGSLESLTDEELEDLLRTDGLDSTIMEAIIEELFRREVLHNVSPRPEETEESTSATEVTSPISRASSEATTAIEGEATSQEPGEIVTIGTTTTPPVEVDPPSHVSHHGNHRHGKDRERHRRPGYRNHHTDGQSEFEQPLPHYRDDKERPSGGTAPVEREENPLSTKRHVGPIIAFTILGFFCFAVFVVVLVVLMLVFRRRRGYTKTCHSKMMSDKQRLGLLKKDGYVNPTYRFHELQDKGEEF